MNDLIFKDNLNEYKLNEEDFDIGIINQYDNIKSKLLKSKKKLNEYKKNNYEKINLMIKKNLLIDHIQGKCNKLAQIIRLIELKNDKYKKCYNCFNIGIILISTTLTMIESCKAVVLNECDEEQITINNYFQLSPIFLSSIITCSASILKFKKYQEKMENIVKLIEKGNTIIGYLKKIREELIFCNNFNDYEKIEDKYKTDIHDSYIIILQDIEKILKDNDYDKYLEYIHNTDYKIHILEQNKKIFFKNFSPDKNYDKQLKKKKNKANYCFC